MRVSIDIWFEGIDDCSPEEVLEVIETGLDAVNATVENLKIEE